jgi:hypothetical protein
VSAEKVVATIDIPNNHQGIERPPRKYSDMFLLADLEATQPIPKRIRKNIPIIHQSNACKTILQLSYLVDSGICKQ